MSKVGPAGLFGPIEYALRTAMKTDRYPSWSQTCAPEIAAPVIVKAIEQGILGNNVRTINIPMSTDPHHYYVPSRDHLLDDPKTTMRILAVTPFFKCGKIPMNTIQNDLACVEGRIIATRNTTVPPTIYNQYLNEVLQFIIPDSMVGTLVPLTFDEVWERQSRPSQRALLARCKDWLYNYIPRAITSFQKCEVYQKPTDPRNISTLPPAVKTRYSTYIYSLSNRFHDFSWYAFSKTPKELELRMNAIAEDAAWVIPTDFSRFDGTHSKWLVDAELSLLLRAFPGEHHKELAEQHGQNFNCSGYTKHGVQYKSENSTPSGSPHTSLFNSFQNVLVAYITFRKQGFTPDEAWNHLGVYGGDDGITPNVNMGVYEEVAKKIGLKLKAERVDRDGVIPFLSRLWFGNWSMPLASMTAPKRQISKLHISTAGPEVPDHVFLHRKALGYLLTDEQTPLMSAWARAVVRMCEYLNLEGDDFASIRKLDSRWFERYDRQDNFTTTEHELRWEVAAADLGITIEELKAAHDRLDSLEGPWYGICDIFFPLWEEPPAPAALPIIADGELILPLEPPAPAAPQPTEQGAIPGPPLQPDDQPGPSIRTIAPPPVQQHAGNSRQGPDRRKFGHGKKPDRQGRPARGHGRSPPREADPAPRCAATPLPERTRPPHGVDRGPPNPSSHPELGRTSGAPTHGVTTLPGF